MCVVDCPVLSDSSLEAVLVLARNGIHVHPTKRSTKHLGRGRLHQQSRRPADNLETTDVSVIGCCREHGFSSSWPAIFFAFNDSYGILKMSEFCNESEFVYVCDELDVHSLKISRKRVFDLVEYEDF